MGKRKGVPVLIAPLYVNGSGYSGALLCNCDPISCFDFCVKNLSCDKFLVSNYQPKIDLVLIYV